MIEGDVPTLTGLKSLDMSKVPTAGVTVCCVQRLAFMVLLIPGQRETKPKFSWHRPIVSNIVAL